jgi:aspartate aminotransferase-like enzyme
VAIGQERDPAHGQTPELVRRCLRSVIGTEANTTLLLVSTNSMVWEAVLPETTQPQRSATIRAEGPVVNLKRTNL